MEKRQLYGFIGIRWMCHDGALAAWRQSVLIVWHAAFLKSVGEVRKHTVTLTPQPGNGQPPHMAPKIWARD